MAKKTDPVTLSMGGQTFAPRVVSVQSSHSPLATTVEVSFRLPIETVQAAVDALKAAGIFVKAEERDDDFRGSAQYRVVSAEQAARPKGVQFVF